MKNSNRISVIHKFRDRRGPNLHTFGEVIRWSDEAGRACILYFMKLAKTRIYYRVEKLARTESIARTYTLLYRITVI